MFFITCIIIAPRRSRAVNGHDQSLRLPDTISMEPFQKYLAEMFPGDGKRSTSGVVHELGLIAHATEIQMTSLLGHHSCVT